MKYFLRNQTRRPKDTSPHVSLFPFLAVLICTMGALVPLLFTVSRQARLQAEQTAATRDEALKADVKSEQELAQWRIEQMQTSRKKTEEDIQTARLELGHLEDHSRRLKARISELEKTVVTIDRSGNDEGQRRAATNAELEELRKQIVEAERQVEEAKAKAAGKKRSFAIVPYEGPNSTHRRPIYIECRGDAVVLQPEGILLTVRDFEGPMGPSNPLAAALRTEREYLLSKNGFDPGRDGEPYPLLLVRPDGIIAYYAARAAMKSWGAEFGYEFVEADWKLAYQPADPQLAQAVNESVASARVIQDRLIAAAPREYKRRASSSASSGSSSRVGGYGSGGGSGSGSGNGGMAGGYARGSGASGGSSGLGETGGSSGGYGTGFGGAGEGGGGNSDSWDNQEPMPGEPDPFLTGKNNPYASLTVGGTGIGGTRTGGRGIGGPGVGVPGVGTSGGGVPGGGVPGGGVPGGGVPGGGVPGSGVPGGGVPGGGVPGGGVPAGSSLAANGVGPAYGGGNGSAATGPGPILGNPNGSPVASGSGGGVGGVGGSSVNANGMMGGGYSAGSGQAMGSGVAQGSRLPAAGGVQGNAGTGEQGNGGLAADSQGNNGGQGVSVGDGRMPAGQGATTGRVAANGQPNSSGQVNMQGQGGTMGQAKPSSEPPDIFASRVAASNAAKYGTDNRSTEDCPASAGVQVAQPLRPGEWHERPKPPPTPMVQDKKDQGNKNKNMLKHRGQDWGLQDNPIGSVPITRPVVLHCQADRLILQPERGRGGKGVVVMASGADSSIDDLVSAIWDRMTQWGMAGRGMYWRPVLHVHVGPGGEQRFSDLQTLLEGSGLDVVKQ